MGKYQAPKVEVVEISPDGILCQSGLENIGENDGIWGKAFYYEYESGFYFE